MIDLISYIFLKFANAKESLQLQKIRFVKVPNYALLRGFRGVMDDASLFKQSKTLSLAFRNVKRIE